MEKENELKYDVESKVINNKEILCLDLRLRCEDTIENRKIMWDCINKIEGLTND